MIKFNGLKFAKNNKEIVESLFNSSGTASGTYKHTKKGTKLFKGNGELFAYIVHNDSQGYFVVSASMIKGKPFYMFGLCSVDEKYLGLDKVSYGEVALLIKLFLEQFEVK